ncbi:MAG: hypothetical protein JO025_22100 [Verrucomicrobia bacterium]|nr:hypothetical protein [Verrucomicrobiota bacterium]
MLTTIIRALRWTDEKLQNLLADLATSYARELLAAHGLVEIDIDHIKMNYRVEWGLGPIAAEMITFSVPYYETTPSDGRLELIRVDTASDPTRKAGSFRRTTPNCHLWTGFELVAALIVAGAAIFGLIFCLAAIFKF